MKKTIVTGAQNHQICNVLFIYSESGTIQEKMKKYIEIMKTIKNTWKNLLGMLYYT